MKQEEIKEEIEVGSDILSENGYFGTLMSITPKGRYSVRYDIDYWGEPRSYFTKKQFYSFFKKVK
jgi:hypothetical protein